MKFRFRNLLIEPYRIFFAFGCLYAVLAVGVWFYYLHALDHSTPLFSWKEGPSFIHAHVMIYGVIGSYVFGFILTAFPRFVEQPLPSSKIILPLWASMVLSQFFLIMGSLSTSGWMMPAGILQTLSYLGLWLFLTRLYLRSGNFRGNKQPIFILFALLSGTVGVCLGYLYFARHGAWAFYQASIEIGANAFLLLLVVAITYRIVPFFTGRVIADYIPRRGRFTLEIVFLLIMSRLLILGLWPGEGRYAVSWAINLLLFIVLFREWMGWIPKHISQAPMLLVLYLGLSWALIFLLFSGYEWAIHGLHSELPKGPLFRTPALHALFIGCFGTLLLGISTRVVRGHGGLPIVADKAMGIALLLIQFAALWRVGIPLLEKTWPILVGKNYWAGLLWCVAFALWALRYIPFLGQAKVENPQ